jgi:hypothetical protein
VLSYRGTIFEPQADGTFRQRGGDDKEVFSKQYLRNLFQLGHLPAFETTVVESDTPPVVEEEESKGDSGIPMPKDRGLTSVSFDDAEGQSQIIGELETLYAPYGDFKFEQSMGNLLITSPTGETRLIWYRLIQQTLQNILVWLIMISEKKEKHMAKVGAKL